MRKLLFILLPYLCIGPLPSRASDLEKEQQLDDNPSSEYKPFRLSSRDNMPYMSRRPSSKKKSPRKKQILIISVCVIGVGSVIYFRSEIKNFVYPTRPRGTGLFKDFGMGIDHNTKGAGNIEEQWDAKLGDIALIDSKDVIVDPDFFAWSADPFKKKAREEGIEEFKATHLVKEVGYNQGDMLKSKNELNELNNLFRLCYTDMYPDGKEDENEVFFEDDYHKNDRNKKIKCSYVINYSWKYFNKKVEQLATTEGHNTEQLTNEFFICLTRLREMIREFNNNKNSTEEEKLEKAEKGSIIFIFLSDLAPFSKHCFARLQSILDRLQNVLAVPNEQPDTFGGEILFFIDKLKGNSLTKIMQELHKQAYLEDPQEVHSINYIKYLLSQSNILIPGYYKTMSDPNKWINGKFTNTITSSFLAALFKKYYTQEFIVQAISDSILSVSKGSLKSMDLAIFATKHKLINSGEVDNMYNGYKLKPEYIISILKRLGVLMLK